MHHRNDCTQKKAVLGPELRHGWRMQARVHCVLFLENVFSTSDIAVNLPPTADLSAITPVIYFAGNVIRMAPKSECRRSQVTFYAVGS